MAKAALKISQTIPLMPKAKASWMVDNTKLTFDQIADFCGLHPLEVQAIADGDAGANVQGINPVTEGDLTKDEIARCEANPAERLQILQRNVPQPVTRAKGPRYTPVSKRADKPNAVAWLLRYHPEFTDGQIAKLIGSTKTTISSIRNRTYADMANIKPSDPVFLGLCKQEELSALIAKYGKKQPPVEAAEFAGSDIGSGDQPDIGEWA